MRRNLLQGGISHPHPTVYRQTIDWRLLPMPQPPLEDRRGSWINHAPNSMSRCSGSGWIFTCSVCVPYTYLAVTLFCRPDPEEVVNCTALRCTTLHYTILQGDDDNDNSVDENFRAGLKTHTAVAIPTRRDCFVKSYMLRERGLPKSFFQDDVIYGECTFTGSVASSGLSRQRFDPGIHAV